MPEEMASKGRALQFRSTALRVEVGDQHALEPSDGVLEHELLLLHSPQLQLVDIAALDQPMDGLVQVAMFKSHFRQPRADLGFVLFIYMHRAYLHTRSRVRSIVHPEGPLSNGFVVIVSSIAIQ